MMTYDIVVVGAGHAGNEAAAAAASAAAKIQELTELLANCQVMPCFA